MEASSSRSRSGKQHRVNTERYFHVMGEGWFVFTREGVNGPHVDRSKAKLVVKKLVDPDSVADEQVEDEDVPRWEEFFLR